MKQRFFLKVIGTLTSARSERLSVQVSRGVMPLKRRDDPIAVIAKFLSDRDIESTTIHERGDSVWGMSTRLTSTEILSFTFVRFESSDLQFQLRDLTETERSRDSRAIRRALQ